MALLYPPSTLGGGGAVLPSTFSMTLADTTSIDPQGGVGMNGSGWVAIVVLPGVTNTALTCDATQLTLTISDPGYTSLGVLTTIVRTIKGTVALRRSYPNGNNKLITTSGGNLTLYISLDDWIYSGSTVTSAVITSTFYPGATTGKSSSSINLSTRAYTKPLFGWNQAQQLSSGATFDVESVAFHRHLKAGRMVACIEYSATDGSNTTASVFASAPQLSAVTKQGNIPEVYAGTLNVAGLTQGVICTVNAKVYPWLGDASAVLDLNITGTAWPTTLPQTKLRFLCDRTGAYGGGYAYVKSGAISGVVSSVTAVARATPYPTITAAVAAMQVWNNANKAHNDVGGGFIRLMDNAGAAQSHGIDATGVTAGLTYLTVEPDPLNVGAITVFGNGLCQMPTLMKWRNMAASSVLSTGAWIFVGQDAGRDILHLDGITFDTTNSGQVMIYYGSYYLTNVTNTGGYLDMAPNSSTLTSVALGSGNIDNGTGWFDYSQKVMIGSRLTEYIISVEGKVTADGDAGRIIYNNRIQGAQVENLTAFTLNKGWANIQNLYERVAVGGARCMNYFSDGDLTTVDNYLDIYNTAIGERCSRMYNDAPAHGIVLYGVEKYGVSKYTIIDNYNIKTDTFNVGTGAPGNMAYVNSVGNVGNISLFGAVNRANTDQPHNDNADVPYLGNVWLSNSVPNVTFPGGTQAAAMALFTNYTVQPQGTPVKGGNYQPLVGAIILKNRVPVGYAGLKYDIAGQLRKNDGTGAAGAYEI